jgi:hypothetical protein
MAAVGAIMLVGCGGGQQQAPPAATPTSLDLSLSATPAPETTAASGDPLDVAEAEALRAYRGMWAGLLEVGKRPDGDAPQLAEYASGAQLQENRRRMREFKRRGVVLRGTVRSAPRVVALVPRTRAIVEDCVDSSRWVEVDAATGRTLPNRTTPPDLNVVTLEPAGGVWKVTRIQVVHDRC